MNAQQAQDNYNNAEQARRNQKQAEEQAERSYQRERDPAKRSELRKAHLTLCEAGNDIRGAAQDAERALYNATH